MYTKQLFALIFFACASLIQLEAQRIPYLEDLDGREKREYRRDFRDAERVADEQLRRGNDIVLDPIEQTPVMVEARSADFTNWGATLLWGGLRERIKSECTYPVLVKIFDTGSAYDHGDLQRGQIPGSNYTSDPSGPDQNGHSTHVAGIIAGQGGGLAYPLVEAGLLSFKAVQVLNAGGSGSFASVANALNTELASDKEFIAGGGYVVSNFSLGGGTSPVAAVEQAAQKAVAAGVVLVAAAGNNAGPVSYPGLSAYFIATSAIDQQTKLASFSNRGPQVVAAAPGVGIVAPYKNKQYASLSGTSMASPFLAASIAIARSKWGPKLPDQAAVELFLRRVATDLGDEGKDDFYGWGLAFIKGILDTDPASGGPNPPPPPPPPNDPGLESPVTAVFPGPYVIRYRREGEQDWSILTVTDIEASYTHQGSAVDAYRLLKTNVEGFFPNRGIVLTNAMQYTDAAWWTGQFIEYVTRNNGFPIQVTELTGTTEQGQQHQASGFDKASRGVAPILADLD